MTDAKQALEVREWLNSIITNPTYDGSAIPIYGVDVACLIEENARLRAWLSVLEPHLDAVICYASDMDEHPPNRVVAEVRAYIAPTQDTTHD